MGGDTLAVYVAKLKREIYYLDAIINRNTFLYSLDRDLPSYEEVKKRLSPGAVEDLDSLEYPTEKEQNARRALRQISALYTPDTALERAHRRVAQPRKRCRTRDRPAQRA